MTGPARNSRLIKLDGLLTALRQTIIIVAITIVLCEIGLRVFNEVYPLPFFYSNSYNRFRIKPHSQMYGFALNSRGFNDVEFKIEKDPGVFRVLGIGDSFAFGMVPYPFNYLTLIEERLNSNGHRSELINMGIPGINPREYLAILLHEGLELKPDMVLLSFFIGNDFTESSKVTRLYKFSYLASLAKYLVDLNTKMANFDFTTSAAYDDEGNLYTNAAYVVHERNLSHIFEKKSKSFEFLLANTLGHLGNIKRILQLAWHTARGCAHTRRNAGRSSASATSRRGVRFAWRCIRFQPAERAAEGSAREAADRSCRPIASVPCGDSAHAALPTQRHPLEHQGKRTGFGHHPAAFSAAAAGAGRTLTAGPRWADARFQAACAPRRLAGRHAEDETSDRG